VQVPNTAGIEAIAALDEPVRRRLYEYVAASGRAVDRDEAARASGVSRSLVAFHLDRLAALGLLTVEFRRLSGRTGRGAGRPNKLYRRAERDFEVHLPPRHYELAAELYAEAIDGLGSRGRQVLDERARTRGQELARAERDAEPEADADPVAATMATLRRLGYEPVLDDGEIALRNCPFHELARTHRDSTCGMNLAMVDGLLSQTARDQLVPRLEPHDGWCCVRITPCKLDEAPSDARRSEGRKGGRESTSMPSSS
jgi:predicted ArsR family transcriptional regulator